MEPVKNKKLGGLLDGLNSMDESSTSTEFEEIDDSLKIPKGKIPNKMKGLLSSLNDDEEIRIDDEFPSDPISDEELKELLKEFGIEDASGLELKNPTVKGGYFVLTINGKETEYLPGTPLSGKHSGKPMTAKDIKEYVESYMKKAPATKVIQWLRANLITKNEARKKGEMGPKKDSIDNKNDKNMNTEIRCKKCFAVVDAADTFCHKCGIEFKPMEDAKRLHDKELMEGDLVIMADEDPYDENVSVGYIVSIAETKATVEWLDGEREGETTEHELSELQPFDVEEAPEEAPEEVATTEGDSKKNSKKK